MDGKVDNYAGTTAVTAGHEKAVEIFTIGHSNRSFEDFLSLLKEFQIRAIADIRGYLNSRKFPHFNRQPLHKQMVTENIEYYWLQILGGRRTNGKKADSPNTELSSL